MAIVKKGLLASAAAAAMFVAAAAHAASAQTNQDCSGQAGSRPAAKAATQPVKYAARSYIIEFSIAMALYVGVILIRPWLIDHATNHALVIAAKILPALPVWLMFAVVWRHYQRIDEFERHKFLLRLAIAFGVGSCLIVTYSFLMDAGLTRLDIGWAWPTLGACWIVTGAIQSIRNRG